MAAMKDNPEVFSADTWLPENADAARYKILKKHVASYRHTDTSTQRVSLTADPAQTGSAGQQAAVNFMQSNGPLQIEGDIEEPQKSPEQLAAEAEERERVKEEKRNKANAPMNKASKFLKNPPADIATVKKTLNEIIDDPHLPSAKKQKLQGDFESYRDSLTALRAQLEESVAAKSVSPAEIAGAQADVLAVRKAFQLFTAQRKIYFVLAVRKAFFVLAVRKAILSQPYRDNEEVGESTPLQPVLRSESKPFWLK